MSEHSHFSQCTLRDIVRLRDGLTWEPYRFDRITDEFMSGLTAHMKMVETTKRFETEFITLFNSFRCEIHKTTDKKDMYIGMN